MSRRDIVVVGASAGGVETLQGLVRLLPADFPAALFVALHFPEHGTSMLPAILSRAGALEAAHPVDGEKIARGRIRVAVPGYHLILEHERVRLVRGPSENGNRPAIDPLFRSAAIAFGPRVIGVVLTGNLDDGTSGLAAIKRRGGIAVVQDPNDAQFPSMPRSAIAHVAVDHVVPAHRLAATLLELTRERDTIEAPPPTEGDVLESKLSVAELRTIEHPSEHPGRVSAYSCPDCSGVMWQLQDGELTRFRCRVGHAWTADGLLARQSDEFEEALWTALRSLEESAALARQMAARNRTRGGESLARRFERQVEAIEARAAVIRAALATPRDHYVDADDSALPSV